ncbi:phosphohydrolase [Shewanella mangrovi]|uniref:Phosphohydrolase n=1 Tax=Shewanella mangrovi TaxID=1515746 RepID=A0A094J9U1_9GAMM|nr:HD-GYP domain-containing protein [Shewanella mangrovi]KFZ36690.1 phosphohydrolase [Shewanella mangrovi]
MAKHKPIQLPVAQLQVGLTVKLPLSWTDHPFLFNKIEIKSAGQIEMIRQLGVPYVQVLSGMENLSAEAQAPAMTNVDQNAADKPLPLDPAQKARKALRLSQKRFIEAMNQSRTMMSKVVSDPEGAVRETAVLVEMMMEHLFETEHSRLALVSSGENSVSITQHGISVATLALVMGRQLALSKPQLREIATGAILHDIGKMKVPESIRRKRTSLTNHEKNFLAMHPNFGYDLLKRSGLFSDDVLNIVLHHHEFIDGSGFPDGLKGDAISLSTQIVSLANDYDSQLWRDDIISPQIALGYLFKNRSGMHQQNLIEALVKVLGIYPPGTLVRLSDGFIGKVMLTTENVAKPQVWSCKVDGSEAVFRFLIDEDVTVEAAIKPDELTSGAAKTLKSDDGISFYIC